MQAAGATAAARPAVAAVASSRAHAPLPPRRPSAQPRHQHEQQQHIQLGTHRQEQLPRQVAAAAARGAAPARQQQQFVQVEPDGSDAWRLDPIVDALKEGAVGIIPTDSNLAFVCDLGNRSAVEKLLTIKRSKDSKRMAILCRSLQDVDRYTLGWPPSRSPGQPDMFKLVRRILPGPYTFILLASKEMPKALTNVDKGRSKKRHEVGVRLPGDPVAMAILEQLDRPLLCTTAGGEGDEDGGPLAPDAAVLMDRYGPQGLDFVVDAGPSPAEGSTVIDCTGSEPVVVRHGKGDTSWLED